MINTIKKLRSILMQRDKQALVGLFFFLIVIFIMETADILVIVPFIAVATDFYLIYKNEYYSKIYNMFSFGVVLISFYIFRSMTKLIISEASNLTTSISSVLFMLNKILQNYHELKREYIILAK